MLLISPSRKKNSQKCCCAAQVVEELWTNSEQFCNTLFYTLTCTFHNSFYFFCWQLKILYQVFRTFSECWNYLAAQVQKKP